MRKPGLGSSANNNNNNNNNSNNNNNNNSSSSSSSNPHRYILQLLVLRNSISQLHASESIHGMYDVTSGCSIAATLSIAVNGEIGRWVFEMCA